MRRAALEYEPPKPKTQRTRLSWGHRLRVGASNTFRRNPGLFLSACGILLTLATAGTLHLNGYRLFRKSAPSHIVLVKSGTYQFHDDASQVDVNCFSMEDEGKVTSLFVMFDRSGTSIHPSPLPVSVSVNSSMAVPSQNGIWINKREQPLKPGLNVFYFSPRVYGRVDVTPDQVSRIRNRDHWGQKDAKDLSRVR